MNTNDQCAYGHHVIPRVCSPSFLLIVVAFVAWRRYRSRRALMRQVRELQALAEAGRAMAEARLDVDELCELIYQLRLGDDGYLDVSDWACSTARSYDIRLWVRDGQRVPPQTFRPQRQSRA